MNADAAVLDFGGVLVEIDFRRAFAAWAKAAGMQTDEISSRFRFDASYCSHERGEIDDREYFATLNAAFGTSLAYPEMLQGWNAIFGEPLPGAERVLRELAARMPVYVFSNTNPSHLAHFTPRYRGLLSGVARVITSCEIGRRKPEPEAFARVAAITGLPPARLAFFDDLEENVAGARRAGLQARRVTAPAEILEALAN